MFMLLSVFFRCLRAVYYRFLSRDLFGFISLNARKPGPFHRVCLALPVYCRGVVRGELGFSSSSWRQPDNPNNVILPIVSVVVPF